MSINIVCLTLLITHSLLKIETYNKLKELFFSNMIILDCKCMPNFKVVTNRSSLIIANNLVSLDDLKLPSDKTLSFICQLFGTLTMIHSPNRVHLSRPNVYSTSSNFGFIRFDTIYLAFLFSYCICLQYIYLYLLCIYI